MLSFFSDHRVSEAISAIAESPDVTVFVGAGASSQVGFPQWEALVNKLGAQAVDQSQYPQEVQRELLDRMQNLDVLARAEMVQALFEDPRTAGDGSDDLQSAILRHLYGPVDPDRLTTGPLVREAARLQIQYGDNMELATTNYDLLLEKALKDELGRGHLSKVRSYRTATQCPKGSFPVRHLHGIASGPSKGGMVLTEGDFHRMQRGSSWQEKWMIERLSSSTCVFVGTSMTDTNLLRYLHGARRSDGSHLRHYTFFTRPSPSKTGEVAPAQTAWEEFQSARWNRIGVQPLFPDNYADITQFLREIQRCRDAGSPYRGVPARLGHWLSRSADSGVRAADGRYAEVQAELAELLEFVRDLTCRLIPGLEDETTQVGLFALHDPVDEVALSRQERVQLLVSSDRIMKDPDTIAPIPLLSRSNWTGVRAITSGHYVAEQKDNYASRWRYIWAAPCVDTGEQIPVGAVALSTTAPASQTALNSIDPGVAFELNQMLEEIGAEILTM